MATRTYPVTEIQIWVRTALGEAPQKALMWRCCLIQRKSNSPCHGKE